MVHGKRVSEKTIRRIKQLAKKKMTSKEIAEKTGVSKTTAFFYLDTENLPAEHFMLKNG